MELFQHQKQGVETLIKSGGTGALFWDMGIGKTVAALKVFEYLWNWSEVTPKLFVVCPASIIESAWGQDIKRFTAFEYSNLRETDNLNANILIVNYERLISKSFAPTLRAIVKIPNLVCVMDECQRIKTYNSKTTKYALAMSKFFSARILLSATPAPNSELEYWPQIEFMVPGALGKNFFEFRARFFALNRGESWIPFKGLSNKEMMLMMQRGYKVQLLPRNKERLTAVISKHCQFLQKRDVLDLPEEIDIIREITMTEEQSKAYKEMFEDLVMEINSEEISVHHAIAKLMKLRQVSGGFSYNREGSAVEFKINPKMEELQEVLNEIGPDKKVVVFCQYKWEIEKIGQLYPQRALLLYGETKDKDKVIHAFQGIHNAILVAHPLSAGVGLSFNDCDYMVFYSLSYSFVDYYQSRGRIMRAEKKNNASYIHLIAKNSMDHIILHALKRKSDNQELFRRIMDERI